MVGGTESFLEEYVKLNMYRYLGLLTLYLETPRPKIEKKAFAPFPVYESFKLLRGDYEMLSKLGALRDSFLGIMDKPLVGIMPVQD